MANEPFSRRGFLRAAAAAPAAAVSACRMTAPPAVITPRPSDIRIEDVSFDFEDFPYRTPYHFGGRKVDRTTLLNVRCAVRTVGGRAARGFGSMTLGNAWSFPSKILSFDRTLETMKALAGRLRDVFAACREAGHPIDLGALLEPECLKSAEALGRELALAEPIPKLCALVTMSPFDAAVHDAFGKAHGRNCYRTYGADHMGRDLAAHLGPEFRGEFVDRYVRREPVGRLPMFHSVGAGDPIEDADVRARLDDGLPQTLPEWIRHNGLRRIKIKLNGGDMAADLERVIRIDRVAAAEMAARRVDDWKYCLDFNEGCPSAGHLVEFLSRLRERAPGGFERIEYVEQPTKRDLKADRANAMHEAARLRPIVADEALVDLESLRLAREMGYTGVALKACKGQTQAMLLAAAAQKFGMYLCVQDLTCPGASLIHSVGIAAHVPGVSGIEANARQYVPAANKPWEGRFPGIFHVTDGHMDTSGLTGPGLGTGSE